MTLGPPRSEDLETYRQWFADLQVTRFLLMRFVPSVQQEQEWYDQMGKSASDVVWAVVAGGKTIGTTAIHGIDWTNRHASSGMLIGDRSAWGHGYATQAVRLRTAYAFRELGLERLETESFAHNAPMHRVLEKAGYQRIGLRRHLYKGGEWHDEVLFELLREDWLASQRDS